MPCCYSVIKSCPTLFNPLDCSKTGFPVLHYLSEFAQIHVHWVGEPSNHLILCSPFPLFLPPTFPASGSFPISQLFTSGCQIIGTSASASFLPMNMILPMISFGIHWFDLFVFQGTLKSLLYHHNLKASILWCSTFFKVQSSHQYFATRKTIALSIWTLVSKMMCLLFIFF